MIQHVSPMSGIRGGQAWSWRVSKCDAAFWPPRTWGQKKKRKEGRPAAGGRCRRSSRPALGDPVPPLRTAPAPPHRPYMPAGANRDGWLGDGRMHEVARPVNPGVHGDLLFRTRARAPSHLLTLLLDLSKLFTAHRRTAPSRRDHLLHPPLHLVRSGRLRAGQPGHPEAVIRDTRDARESLPCCLPPWPPRLPGRRARAGRHGRRVRGRH